MLDFKGALIRTYRVLDPEMAETQNYRDIKRWLADGYIDLSEELELHILNFKLCRQHRDINAGAIMNGTKAERVCYPSLLDFLAEDGYHYEETLQVSWTDLRDLSTVEIGRGPYFYAKVYGGRYYVFFGNDDGTAVCYVFTKDLSSDCPDDNADLDVDPDDLPGAEEVI